MPIDNELFASPSTCEDHQLALWASPEAACCESASLVTAEAPPPWVLFHVPHDSTFIPPELRSQFALTDAELADELIKMTDHLTLALFTPGVPEPQVIQAPVSRLVVDVERFEDDRQESMASRGMGAVYLRTSSGQALRHPLPARARRALIETWYRPHHARLRAATQRCMDAFGQALLIDAHSFPSRPLPYEEADPQLQRPDICIGTDRFHTPKALEEAFVKAFQADGFRVAVNSPFSGALVPAGHHRQDARVSAVMVEVNRGLYLDEATGQGASGFARMSGRIRRCIQAAIEAWVCARAAELPAESPATPAAEAARSRRLPALQEPMPPFETHRRLCFYPSSGDRLLWAVMELDCDLFVMADKQRQAVSWRQIEADFQKHHLPVELLHRSAQHLCFRSQDKTAWIFFEDNNATLRRLSLANLTIDHFVGICDGCAEGGNYECVHERPFLSHVLQLAAQGMAYTTDHSRPLEERPHGWACGTPAQPRFRTAMAWRNFPPPPKHQRRTGPEWAQVPEATRFVLQGVLVAPCRQRHVPLRKADLVTLPIGEHPTQLDCLSPFRTRLDRAILAEYRVSACADAQRPLDSAHPSPRSFTMPTAFDHASSLWPHAPGQPGERFFPELHIRHRRQAGGSCVSTGLSLLTGEEPADVRRSINTQDPVSWSRYLQGHGMKLAYCPSDLRRLRHYKDQLLALDDLFTLSTYSAQDLETIGAEPDEKGWVCGSHFVILHQGTVYDTRYTEPIALEDYPDLSRYVKRLFRVVPARHARGL